MMQVMSEEEREIFDKELNKWINDLDWTTKQNVRSLLLPIMEQRDCRHDWIDPTTYENQMPKDKVFCTNCSLTRDINYFKLEKVLNEVLIILNHEMAVFGDTFTLNRMFAFKSEEEIKKSINAGKTTRAVVDEIEIAIHFRIGYMNHGEAQ